MSKKPIKQRRAIRKPIEKENDNSLAAPFPSPPMTTPRYYISVQTKRGRMESMTFAATYAAKRFVDALLIRETFRWLDEYTIETNNIIIRCEPNLYRIIDHSYSALESEWRLPCPYDRMVARIVAAY